MSFQPLSEQAQERIHSASPDVSNAALAEELGVSERTVRRHRKKARDERREVAREVLQDRVEREMPNALAALGDCVRVAHSHMLGAAKEEAGDAEKRMLPDYIRETRASAKQLLDYLGLEGEKDPLEAAESAAIIEEIDRRGLMRSL